MIDQNFIVAGTDTGIGKTTLAALLMLALDGRYWKPVQSGMDGETDSEAVLRITGLPADRILPEAYRLTRPLSPDQSARYDGITIDPARLALPNLSEAPRYAGGSDAVSGRSIERPSNDLSSDSSFISHPSSLIIESAGGLMVPFNDDLLQIDLFPRWGAPVVLAARSVLGTLNHTLLSIEALRSRAIPLAGIVLIGHEHPDNMATLERWSDAPIVGTIPYLASITRAALLDVYATRFLPIDAWSLLHER